MNLERIQHTPHSGGDRRSWPPRLILKCHNNGHTGHTDVYGRMDWDKVAPTLTARCYSLSNGRYGHPTQDRAISLREAAALQSFPMNMYSTGHLYPLVGKSEMQFLSKWQKQWANILSVVQKCHTFRMISILKIPHLQRIVLTI